jgi:hypothetical protein
MDLFLDPSFSRLVLNFFRSQDETDFGMRFAKNLFGGAGSGLTAILPQANARVLVRRGYRTWGKLRGSASQQT